MTVLKNILAPTDFSENNRHAIQYAYSLAKQSGSTLHLLYVAKDDLELKRKKNQLDRLAWVFDNRNELHQKTTRQVAMGNPADIIVDYARHHEIDMIVMGTHGRSGLLHLLVGSVTEKVLREAPCPVTVLGPHDGEYASLAQAFEVIKNKIGNGLKTGEEDGRGLLAKTLVEELRVASTTAIIMVDELEHREILKWENGNWIISEEYRLQGAADELSQLEVD